jgi:hypothetical protein
MRIALEMLAESISMRAEISGGFFAIPRTACSKRYNRARAAAEAALDDDVTCSELRVL